MTFYELGAQQLKGTWTLQETMHIMLLAIRLIHGTISLHLWGSF